MKITSSFTRIRLPADLASEVSFLYGSIAEKLETLIGEQSVDEATLAALQATRHEDIDSAVIEKTRAANNQLLDSLKTELKIRTELQGWYHGYVAAFAALETRRQKSFKALAADILAKLEGIGFEAGKIEPRMLDAHTGLRTAKKAYESARDFKMHLGNLDHGDADHGRYKENLARVEEIRKILGDALRNAGAETHDGASRS